MLNTQPGTDAQRGQRADGCEGHAGQQQHKQRTPAQG
jgi:hypothetical protein